MMQMHVNETDFSVHSFQTRLFQTPQYDQDKANDTNLLTLQLIFSSLVVTTYGDNQQNLYWILFE